MKIIEVPIESLGDQSLEAIASRMRVVEGVSNVAIMEITGQILVYCDRESITLAELVGETIESSENSEANPKSSDESGGNGSASPSMVRLRIQGMHCAGCENALENVLGKIAGVESVKAELVTGRATIFGSHLDPQSLCQTVQQAGYQAEMVKARSTLFQSICDTHRRNEKTLFKRWVLAFACVMLLVFSLLIQPEYSIWWVIALTLATAVQVVCGLPYVVSAFRLLRHGQTNMDTLVALGTTAAYVGAVTFGDHNDYHKLMESPMILGVVGFGKWLESLAINRAVTQLANAEQRDDRVLIEDANGGVSEVPVEMVVVGQVMVVRTGEKVHLDGKALEPALVSRAWLTGEVEPQDVAGGDMVYAGSVNEGGRFSLQVSAESGETRFDQIMDRLEQSLGQRPAVQQMADRVVSVFVPILVAIAALTFTFWAVVFQSEVELAWKYTVSVLVIACPCALGLATPVATLISGTRALSLGALVVKPTAMEVLSQVNQFVLDKTGTLTSARLHVDSYEHSSDLVSIELALRLFHALEQHSTHPVAHAIVAYCEEEEAGASTPLDVLDVDTQVGRGISGLVDGYKVSLLNDRAAENDFDAVVNAEEPGTHVWCVINQNVVGCFVLNAVSVPGASKAVADLKQWCEGEQGVVMASGDRHAACVGTAGEVGISEVFSEMTPETKGDLVKTYQAEGKVVALVGDGINDAVALAGADVGIAAYGGADIASQSADIVLTKMGLNVLGDLIPLSRATSKVIRQNLIWAFLYNLLAIPIAAGALTGLGIVMNPIIAATIMATSSMLVVLNSLRLRRVSLG